MWCQAEVENERKMDEGRKSWFNAKGLMDRRLGVQVYFSHTAQGSDSETVFIQGKLLGLHDFSRKSPEKATVPLLLAYELLPF